jgi:Lon-like ATP-dependent protease
MAKKLSSTKQKQVKTNVKVDSSSKKAINKVKTGVETKNALENKVDVKTNVKADVKVKASTDVPKEYERLKYTTTADIKVSDSMIEQVIGQDEAVDIVKKAARQRRHVLLIGEPGTGKSMLGMALAELLPKEKLVDVLAFPNPNDENVPLIRVVPAGKGRDFVNRAKVQNIGGVNILSLVLIAVIIAIGFWQYYQWVNKEISDIVYVGYMFITLLVGVGFMFSMSMSKRIGGNQPKVPVPKTVVDNFGQKVAPFVDATGAHEGALLGDVMHDPFQTGGLGTPAHNRVVAGMIHKANMGVLFLDEISILSPQMQQELLTVLQEGKMSITGRSERSAGAMVRTESVPCNFIMVAAGNYDSISRMHPALRSRIRGYGYEVYMNDMIKDTPQNLDKIAIFIAQEVKKDKKIPPFDKSAIDVIIEEARRRAGRKNHLTIRFRELGGIIRAAGDIAIEENATIVTDKHVRKGMHTGRPLEKQISDKIIERKKEYEVIVTSGVRVGRVNGLAVMGGESTYSGIVLPIEAAVVPGGKQNDIIATGKLGEIAKEAVINVSAMIKSWLGEDYMEGDHKKDIYIQFLQTYEGVEGDSASIAVAVATISALKGIPVKQNLAMTGSLSVRGDVLPVGGVSYKIEGAIEAGLTKVLIPFSNANDIVMQKEHVGKIEIIPVKSFIEVLEQAFDWTNHKDVLAKIKSGNK